MNNYLDINFVDRSKQVKEAFIPTLEDIKDNPQFYAELVNDLMFHWVYGTRETSTMISAKNSLLLSYKK